MAACFLCESTFTNSTKKKRKLLFGKAAARYIDTLDEWTDEVFCSKFSDAITDETKPLAYICSRCCSAVDDWHSFVKKASDIKNLMLTSVRRHCSVEVSHNNAIDLLSVIITDSGTLGWHINGWHTNMAL